MRAFVTSSIDKYPLGACIECWVKKLYSLVDSVLYVPYGFGSLSETVSFSFKYERDCPCRVPS